MKKYFFIAFLFLGFYSSAQDSVVSVYSINKDRYIVGYLICYSKNNKITKVDRIDKYSSLEGLGVLSKKKQKKATISELKKYIPKYLLKEDEYLKCVVRDNGL